MDALFEYIAVGDHYVIPTGIDSEIQIIKDKKENLENLEVVRTDGSGRVTIKGKFNSCVGPVNVEVCSILVDSSLIVTLNVVVLLQPIMQMTHVLETDL